MASNALIELEVGAIAAVSKTPPDEARTKRRVEALLELARSMEIKTQDDCDRAAAEVHTIISIHKELDDERTGYTGPLNAILDKFNGRFMPYLKLLRGDGKKGTESAESILKAKIGAFLTEQERLATVAREKAEAEAQAERDRLEAVRVEQERVAAEEQARANRARSDAGREAAQQRADAAMANSIAAGMTAAVVTAQPIMSAPARVAGMSTAKTFDYELQSALHLMEFIVTKRPDLVVLFELSDAKMKAQIRLQGEGTVLPGVRIFPKTGLRAR